MQLTAKLHQLLALQNGTGKNCQWNKQDRIIETEDQYPKKICVSIWADKINKGQLQIGNELGIDFGIESRDYSGRWYSDIKAWKIHLAGTVPRENETLLMIRLWRFQRMSVVICHFKSYCAAQLHNCVSHLHRN